MQPTFFKAFAAAVDRDRAVLHESARLAHAFALDDVLYESNSPPTDHVAIVTLATRLVDAYARFDLAVVEPARRDLFKRYRRIIDSPDGGPGIVPPDECARFLQYLKTPDHF